jgi:hypothetical protein
MKKKQQHIPEPPTLEAWETLAKAEGWEEGISLEKLHRLGWQVFGYRERGATYRVQSKAGRKIMRARLGKATGSFDLTTFPASASAIIGCIAGVGANVPLDKKALKAPPTKKEWREQARREGWFTRYHDQQLWPKRGHNDVPPVARVYHRDRMHELAKGLYDMKADGATFQWMDATLTITRGTFTGVVDAKGYPPDAVKVLKAITA